MIFIENNDIMTFTLLSLIILCMTISLLFWAIKSYEAVITLMLLSPMVSWVFSENIPVAIGAIQEEGSSSYIRVSIVLILGMLGYLNFFKLKVGSHAKAPLYFKLFAVFLLCALLTTTYSIDRFYTFIRASQSIALLGFLLGLFYWLKDTSHLDKALNIYFGVMLFGIIINIFSLVLLPDRAWWWNAPERFQGVAGHPNSLGAFCMLSYPALMWKYGKTFYRGRFLIAILFCSVLLMHIISGSRTSLAASIFGLIVWNLALKNKAKLLIIFTLFVILGSGFLLNPIKVPSFERGESNNIINLTGRTDFWRASIQLIIEKPILGYGYEVAGKVWSDPRYHSKDLSLWAGSARTSLHNGYLSLVIGTGIILSFVLFTVLLIPLWKIIFTEPGVYKSLVLVIMLPILLLNMFESALLGAGGFISLVLWFFWVIAARLPDIIPSKNT